MLFANFFYQLGVSGFIGMYRKTIEKHFTDRTYFVRHENEQARNQINDPLDKMGWKFWEVDIHALLILGDDNPVHLLRQKLLTQEINEFAKVIHM